jgi:hypothetical protein
MPLSSVVGAQSIIKPGVCTSSTRPAVPFEGQMIFETDTDRLYVYNGTAWVIPNSPAQNPMGLELVTTATCTSGGTASGGVVTIGTTQATVTVTNAFNATYSDYRVVISGVTCSTANNDIRVKFETSLSTYNWAGTYQTYSGPTTITGTGAANTSNGIAVGASETSGNFSCSFDVQRPNLASSTVVTGTHANAAYRTTYSGIMNTSTAYTDLIVNQSGGATMTGGTIRVYGYRNS